MAWPGVMLGVWSAGPVRAGPGSDWVRWRTMRAGAVARPGVGWAEAPARRGDLREELLESIVESVRKRRERGECEAAEGGVLSFRCFMVRGDVSPIFFGGEAQFEKFRKFHGFGSFQSGVHSVPVAGAATGARQEGGSGVGRRQGSASASGGMVQSDQRRGASETGTVPTARVHHKEPICTYTYIDCVQ